MGRAMHPCLRRALVYGLVFLAVHFIALYSLDLAIDYSYSLVSSSFSFLRPVFLMVVSVFVSMMLINSMTRSFISIVLYTILLMSYSLLISPNYQFSVFIFLILIIILIINILQRRFYEPLVEYLQYAKLKIYFTPILLSLLINLIMQYLITQELSLLITLPSFLAALLISPFSNNIKLAIALGSLASNPLTLPLTLVFYSHMPIPIYSECKGITIGKLIGYYSSSSCLSPRSLKSSTCFICADGDAKIKISKDKYKIIIISSNDSLLNRIITNSSYIMIETSLENGVNTLEEFDKELSSATVAYKAGQSYIIRINEKQNNTIIETMLTILLEQALELDLLLVIKDSYGTLSSIIASSSLLHRTYLKLSKIVVITKYLANPSLIRKLLIGESSIIIDKTIDPSLFFAIIKTLGLPFTEQQTFLIHEILRELQANFAYPSCNYTPIILTLSESI